MTNAITYNYEILCVLPVKEAEKRERLVEEIKKIIAPSELNSSLEENQKLAYKAKHLEKYLETADYLLLKFNTDTQKYLLVNNLLCQSALVIRHLSLNLDTEPKIKIKSFKRKREEAKENGESKRQIQETSSE